jgi:colanic acid biosynthesis glycosyl transferase WcaI
MLAQLIWKPDIIVCFIPTLFSAPIGWLVARLSGAKCWLHIQDYELDTALNLDMMPGRKLLRSIAQAFESFVLTRFDRVSSISESMLARAVQKGVARKKTFLFPNWVNTHQIFPMQGHNPLRDELGIDKNKKVILYHGNLGRKQGLDILINAALSLQDQSDILFLICGEGVEREDLERRILKMKNVRFVDLQPIEKLNQLVNLADVHVLPQRAGAADLVMPSKLTTMLASGKPVLACASPGTQLWKVVNEVGWVIPPEDTLALTKAIISLVGNRAECQRLGKLGRDFSCKYLEKGYILSEFKKAIDVLIYPSPNYELRSLKSPHYRGFILELLNHFFR